MRRSIPLVAAALVLAGAVLVLDHALFNEACEARSAKHFRPALGPCMIINNDGTIGVAP